MAEALLAVGGEEAAGSDSSSELSGSEGEESSDAELEGGDSEAAEMLAVVRAARRQAATERAAAVQTQGSLPSQASGPHTPGDSGALVDPPSPTGAATAEAGVSPAPAAEAAPEPAGAAGEAAPGGSAELAAKADARLARAEAEADQKELFQAAIVRRVSERMAPACLAVLPQPPASSDLLAISRPGAQQC